jgi:iron complex outermembrane receptor protein
MSELLTKQNGGRNFQWQLLATASVLALLPFLSGHSAKAADEDADRPTIWIELGGQLERSEGHGEPFVPGFVAANQNSPVLKPASPLQAQNPPPFSFAEDAKISFQPEASDWVLSAAARIGRSTNFKHVDHQTNKIRYEKYVGGNPTHSPNNIETVADFADTQSHRRESYGILDFSVGKDIGLGRLGSSTSSVLSFGVRFAQFSSAATFDVRARPDLKFKEISFPAYHITFRPPYFHTYHATGQSSRGFRGIGPTLSWDGSASILGDPQDGEVTIDWGANGAVLFGKQKAHVRHHESAHYLAPQSNYYSTAYPAGSGGHDTDRSIVVPNAGGFAGLTFRLQNFKVSAGYRADLFFNAMDGGIDTRKSESVGFYGPFATVSVGLGG